MGVLAATPAGVRTVVCYLRTANPGTVGQRHLHRQRAKLQAEITAQDWTVCEGVEDLHQSGTTLHRPGLQHALALLADRQADALLAADLLHLAVDTALLGQLVERAAEQGWQLLTLSPTAQAGWTATMADPGCGRGCGGARR
jgi:DNA invertase Pin-like site-specific DNA recombinase